VQPLDVVYEARYDLLMDIFEKLFASSIQNSEAGFVRENVGPFLLRRKTDEEVKNHEAESSFRTANTEESGARRLSRAPVLINEESLSMERPRFSQSGELMLPGPSTSQAPYACYSVEKTNRNIFSNGITIGRTSNNDVVIVLASISKFHAWLKKEAGSYILYDAINSQGTFVGTQKVSPNGEQGIVLRNGVEIGLGTNKLTFFDAVGLYRWFQTEFTG
jgi:hypothetical protein